MPGIVSVPGGQTSASFTVTTFAVGNNTSVTITAFFDTTTSANLTVTAGAHALAHTSAFADTSGVSPRLRLPPHLAFLHRRSSVQLPTRASRPEQTSHSIGAMSPGATSYTIQIDDQDNFPSPLIVNQTVTPLNSAPARCQHSGCGGASARITAAVQGLGLRFAGLK